jgi:YD repeat-containing protein
LKRYRSYSSNYPTTTAFAYDALNRLASVTDPRSVVTRYVNNWLDLPEKITSPDTGVTDKTYDAAGNVKTSKDARGQTTTYLYDDLNRRVKATHADGSVIAFVYDQGDQWEGSAHIDDRPARDDELDL